MLRCRVTVLEAHKLRTAFFGGCVPRCPLQIHTKSRKRQGQEQGDEGSDQRVANLSVTERLSTADHLRVPKETKQRMVAPTVIITGRIRLIRKFLQERIEMSFAKRGVALIALGWRFWIGFWIVPLITPLRRQRKWCATFSVSAAWPNLSLASDKIHPGVAHVTQHERIHGIQSHPFSPYFPSSISSSIFLPRFPSLKCFFSRL